MFMWADVWGNLKKSAAESAIKNKHYILCKFFMYVENTKGKRGLLIWNCAGIK